MKSTGEAGSSPHSALALGMGFAVAFIRWNGRQNLLRGSLLGLEMRQKEFQEKSGFIGVASCKVSSPAR
jgi:hypothetical protein